MNNWTSRRLGDVLEKKISVDIKKGFEYSFVPMEAVETGFKYPKTVDSKIFNGSGSKFAEGDTLYARITPCLQNKKICTVKNLKNGVGFGSAEFFILRANKKLLDSNFLSYIAKLDGLNKTAELSMIGASGRQRADIKSLYEFEVKIPDLVSQSSIANLLSQYDDLIENNEKRIKILEEMAQRLYTEWFVKFKFPGHEKVKMIDSPLGKIPEGWEEKKLSDVTDYISRGISPRYDENADSTVLNQKCIRGQKIDFKHSRKQAKSISYEKQLKFGDILINSTGVGTLGRVAQVYEDYGNCTVDSHVSIVRFSKPEYYDYLGMTLLNLGSYLTRMGMGATGQTELSRSTIQNVDVLFPDLEIQKEFSEHISDVRKLTISLSKKNTNLSEIRDLLIPQLVTGKKELKN